MSLQFTMILQSALTLLWEKRQKCRFDIVNKEAFVSPYIHDISVSSIIIQISSIFLQLYGGLFIEYCGTHIRMYWYRADCNDGLCIGEIPNTRKYHITNVYK